MNIHLTEYNALITLNSMNSIIFDALAEPNRLNVIELLKKGGLSVNDIAKKLQLRQPQTTKHLQTLAKAGLVKVTPVAQKRIYELCPETFYEISHWANTYQAIWEDRLELMDDYAKKIAAQTKTD